MDPVGQSWEPSAGPNWKGQPAYGCPRPTSYASRAWYCSCALNSMANPDLYVPKSIGSSCPYTRLAGGLACDRSLRRDGRHRGVVRFPRDRCHGLPGTVAVVQQRGKLFGLSDLQIYRADGSRDRFHNQARRRRRPGRCGGTRSAARGGEEGSRLQRARDDGSQQAPCHRGYRAVDFILLHRGDASKNPAGERGPAKLVRFGATTLRQQEQESPRSAHPGSRSVCPTSLPFRPWTRTRR